MAPLAAMTTVTTLTALTALAFTVVEAAGRIEDGRHQLYAKRESALEQENG